MTTRNVTVVMKSTFSIFDNKRLIFKITNLGITGWSFQKTSCIKEFLKGELQNFK